MRESKCFYKNHKLIILLISVVLVVLLSLLALNKINPIKDLLTQISKEEIQKGIELIPYSNENNLLWVSIIVTDTENGIDKILIPDSEEEIICYGKTKVAYDYKIETNGEYTFSAINRNGEEIKETFVIDDEYRESLIGIDIQAEKELGTYVDVTIDYKEFGSGTYKIGNSTTWKSYSDTFQLTSYDVIKNNLADEDGKTVTIYAKVEDSGGRKIILSKQTINLDLDMPDTPVINFTGHSYPTLYSTGMALGGTLSIDFEDRNDAINYYSFDNENWIQYTGAFSTSNNVVYAKSCKKISGLTTDVVSQTSNSQLAGDALTYEGYDKNNSTSSYGQKMWYIDSSAWGKTMSVYVNNTGFKHRYFTVYLYGYNSAGGTTFSTSFGDVTNSGNKYTNRNITIPSDTVTVKFNYRASQLKTIEVSIVD